MGHLEKGQDNNHSNTNGAFYAIIGSEKRDQFEGEVGVGSLWEEVRIEHILEARLEKSFKLTKKEMHDPQHCPSPKHRIGQDNFLSAFSILELDLTHSAAALVFFLNWGCRICGMRQYQ